MRTFWKWMGGAVVGLAFAACSNGEVTGFSPGTDAGKAGAQSDAATAQSEFGDYDASAPTWSAFEEGELAIEGRGCAECHQSSNPSDGVLSGQMTPVPGTQSFGANLTPDITTGIGAYSDAEILAAIRTGADPSGASLCGAMPLFPDVDDDEGASILAYLRGIPPVKRQIPESECDESDAGAEDAGPIADASLADATADGASDASLSGGPSCASLVAPNVSAQCHACEDRPCQQNGCFGGFFCDTVSFTCQPWSACLHDQ